MGRLLQIAVASLAVAGLMSCANVASKMPAINPHDGGNTGGDPKPPVDDVDCGTAPATNHSTLPLTCSRIHLFSDQLNTSSMSSKMIQFVATHYDGAQKLLREDNEKYTAINPQWVLLHYRLGTSSGPANYIHNDLWSNDYAAEVSPHEDWFMHNQNNARHCSPPAPAGDDWCIHDVTNSDFRNYWVTSVINDMRATGAQGVFADSFEAGISGYGVVLPDVRFQGTNPGNAAIWPGGITWLNMLKSWIDHIETAFANTTEKFLYIPNIGAQITSWSSMDYSTVDGAFLESFAQVSNTADWQLGLMRALRLAAANKIVIAQPYPHSQQERDFLIASFLLIQGDYTFLNLGGMGVHYFPEYDIHLGKPLHRELPTTTSDYVWNGVYRRDFQHGFVLVNPSGNTVNVNLGGTYRLALPQGGGDVDDSQIDATGKYTGGSLTYQSMSFLNLAPWSGAFLLQ